MGGQSGACRNVRFFFVLSLTTPVQFFVTQVLNVPTIEVIGGHGFWDGVGVHTPGVGQKICRPPSAAKIFFRWSFHQGVISLNRNEKKCSPQGSICPIIFSPWGYQGGGVYLFHLGCRPQKVFYPGVHPPTPPPRAHL